MAITAPNPASSPDDQSDTILEFPDNRLLIDLCGELDRNIVQVESRLGVAIHRRGNHLALHGPAPEREQAERVLRSLYQRLEQGRAVTPGDIEAAIRLGPGPDRGPAAPVEARMSQLADSYLRLIDRIRAARPDMAVSGDFIVGFPGESEADFQATLAVVEAVGYAQAYSFAYSPRPGTPAADRPQVDPDTSAERLQRLQRLIARQQAAFQARLVGRTLPVLIEKPGRLPGQVAGRSPYLNAVHLEAAADLLGTIVPVRVLAASPNSLAGALAA